jgi:RPA family protein
MSADDGDGDDGPVGTREVANRVFAAEYDDATVSFKESDEERAPSYVVTPSGAKANRIFFVGVLTEVEDVNEDMLRARVVDPTGAFVVYAGQYQPDARTFFERADPPEFVAVSGKARTFTPDDSDRVFTSVRPESVNAVDADTRDRWVVDAAEATLARVGAMARALEVGADEDPEAAGLAPAGGPAVALREYGTTPAYLAALRDLATDAAAVVAGDRDEVRPLDPDPADPGPADLDALADLADGDAVAAAAGADGEPIDAAAEPTATADEGAGEATTADATPGSGSDAESADAGSEPEAEATATAGGSPAATGGSEPEVGSEPDPEPDPDAGADPEVGAGSGSEPEAGTDAAGGSDDLGDFEPGGGFDEDGDGGDVEVEGSPDELYELDEEERREVEEEFGTEFSTGTEVDDPGEADIETPDPGDVPEEPADPTADAPTADAPGSATESDPAGAGPVDDPEPADDAPATDDATPEAGAEAGADPGESDPEGDDAPADAGDVDLDEYVVDRMRELDDGTGADREELVAAVVEATGADPGEVEDAIQDALMSGQCYEPDDDTLKPI